jgi:sugar phosphate isomerase/epimerase
MDEETHSMRGPGIFLAQFVGDEPPFNSLASISEWAAGHGYKGLQIPTSESRFIDLEKAASSQDYCDELKGTVAEYGLEITELSTHLQGQLVAVHPAYDELFKGFGPDALRGDAAGRTEWAMSQLKMAARASQRLGLSAHATFSGSLLWHLAYPWPQRPPGLVEMGFAELAKRWLPILDAFDEAGVDLCYEIHPGEDLHDGVTFERFLEATQTHTRAKILYDPSHFVLQQLDYLAFIDLYHDLIKAFHVKDAEFIASGRSGVYGGYQSWIDRPGRFRSVGDGQIDFNGIFSRFAQYGYGGWAVLEWECCLKDSEQGAIEGAPFIKRHMIQTAMTAFDDFSNSDHGADRNKRLLGLS